jgi:hypothetical protein
VAGARGRVSGRGSFTPAQQREAQRLDALRVMTMDPDRRRYTDAARSLTGYKIHATAPFEAPGSGDEIAWIDLDFEIAGDDMELQDGAQFHDHTHSMGYPHRIVRGAWSGISRIAARYTNGDWPFDGSLQEWTDGAEG